MTAHTTPGLQYYPTQPLSVMVCYDMLRTTAQFEAGDAPYSSSNLTHAALSNSCPLRPRSGSRHFSPHTAVILGWAFWEWRQCVLESERSSVAQEHAGTEALVVCHLLMAQNKMTGTWQGRSSIITTQTVGIDSTEHHVSLDLMNIILAVKGQCSAVPDAFASTLTFEMERTLQEWHPWHTA